METLKSSNFNSSNFAVSSLGTLSLSSPGFSFFYKKTNNNVNKDDINLTYKKSNL